MSDRSIPLRPARPDDVDEVRACVIAAYAKYRERMDRDPAPMLDDYTKLTADRVVHVAESDDKGPGPAEARLVGAIVFWPRDGHLYIDNIAVHPDAQGSGVGVALLALADEECRAAGLFELRLYTNEVMAENVGFYTRRGWIETHRAVENGYRRIYFRRTLA